MLATMCAVSALGAAAAALAPMSDEAPVALNAVNAVIAVVLLVVVWCASHRIWLHVISLAVVAGVTSVVAAAATPQGAAGLAISYVWVPVFAAFFFSRRVARAYVATIVAAFGGALAVNPFPGAVNVWFLTALTTAVAAEAIAITVRRLESLAVTDPLTGALNRDGLQRDGERLLATARRDGSDVTVVVIDLDGFKRVNDTVGHAGGDQILVDLVAAWRPVLRPADLLGRQGGDEFVLVLWQTGRAGAEALLERLLGLSPIAWSSGVAVAVPGDRLSAVLERADGEMYRAKSRQRT
jgi:diguanylate cyclase (GGDEF)-like protein